MKNFSEYFNIHEKLYISKNIESHNYSPSTKEELKELVEKLLDDRGCDADLNDIDVSKIKNMHGIFCNNGDRKVNIRNINISRWEVSQVEDMTQMFWNCEDFNCDLSHWNVKSVEATSGMFYNCKKLNCDLSNWELNRLKYCLGMFTGCSAMDLPKWYYDKLDKLYKR